MENFVPVILDPTQTPVGSIFHLTQNRHLVDMVNAMVCNFGFNLKSTDSEHHSFVVECDLTKALTDMNIMEAKEEAQQAWVNAWGFITDTLEKLPLEFKVPALSLTTWDGSTTELWRHPNTRK
jgi:hypothetical protein